MDIFVSIGYFSSLVKIVPEHRQGDLADLVGLNRNDKGLLLLRDCMSKGPLEALVAGTSNYNCRTLFERSSGAHHYPFRLRSRSLDNDFGTMSDQTGESKSLSAVTHLHSSFDATLFDDEQEESIFRRSNRVSDASSWEECADGEQSGRKHHLQLVSIESAPLSTPGTVRKLPRRNSNPGATNPALGDKTPRRHHSRPPTSKQTPSSASRRRRAPLLQRDSPYRKSPFRMPPAARTFNQQEANIPPVTGPKPLLGTPSQATPIHSKVSKTRKPETCQTATTAENSFDATTVDSQDPFSPASTPFRFASFPASLPRVNPRSYMETSSPLDGPACPTTLRKRMNFTKGKELLEGDYDYPASTTKRASRYVNISSMSNASRDEEGTQNSSMSSMSAEAFSHMQTMPSFPPPVSKLDGIVSKFSDDSDMPENPQARPLTSLNTKLFMYDHEDYDDSEDVSPIGINVAKTRLNFNVGTSPSDQKFQGQRLAFGNDDERNRGNNVSVPYEHEQFRNFSSTTLTSSPSQNIASFEKNSVTFTTAPISPARSRTSNTMNQGLDQPSTPDEVQIHFHVDGAQCSPIPGILEEDGNIDMDLESSISPTNQGQCDTSRCSENEDTVKLSLSQGSSGSSTNSKLRRLRPMPDMSAFDAGGSVRSLASSRNDKSGEDFIAQPQSPKLLCPPTPVRTPAWAHNEHGVNPFARANSLIVTKVLATCPVKVVEGHSSLENSLIEDEVDQRRTSLSFSTVDEEMEQQDSRLMHVPTSEGFDSSVSAASLQVSSMQSPLFSSDEHLRSINPMPKMLLPSKLPPPKFIANKNGEVGSVVSFASDFENLGLLGRGSFADVYKVRSRQDGQLYAVKKNRRQFRGKRDRDLAMAEVRTMQTLQNVCVQTSNTDVRDNVNGSYSLYVLFFYRAWQEEGFFFCQTELCCRDTCRELHDSLTSDWQTAVRKYPSLLNHLQPNECNPDSDMNIDGRLMPVPTLWKICHNVAAGLSHIHSCGIVHRDIKPSNILFVSHPRFGAMCKIGDLGMAGEIGSCEDGQEGDTVYMAPELLSSGVKQPSADIFSLGLTLYEMAAGIGWELPSEGPRWHDLRSGSHIPELPSTRSYDLINLIQRMIQERSRRPSADVILREVLVSEAGSRCDEFLRDYVKDTEEFDRIRQERVSIAQREAIDIVMTPRHMDSADRELRTPTPGVPLAPVLFATPPPVTN